MRHPLLLALCAGFSGCLSAEPLVWPPELLKLGSRFLVVTDSAGDRSVLVVDPSVSTLIPSDALGHLQLLGYPEPPEALGISISDGRVLLAKAGSTVMNDVVQYAAPITSKGFVLMDTPGFDPASGEREDGRVSL